MSHACNPRSAQIIVYHVSIRILADICVPADRVEGNLGRAELYCCLLYRFPANLAFALAKNPRNETGIVHTWVVSIHHGIEGWLEGWLPAAPWCPWMALPCCLPVSGRGHRTRESRSNMVFTVGLWVFAVYRRLAGFMLKWNGMAGDNMWFGSGDPLRLIVTTCRYCVVCPVCHAQCGVLQCLK